MSLTSTFYFGDAPAIAEALQAARYADAAAASAPPPCDFSGGIQVPFLMEEDFDALFAMGARIDKRLPKTFGDTFDSQLSDPSEQERGTHLLRPDVCDAFVALPTSALQQFSDEWNTRRKLEQAARRGGCLRDAALWKILAGFTLGLGAFAAVERTIIPLYYLAGVWLLLIGGATFLDRPRRKHAAQLRTVDWRHPLQVLQQRIASARAEGRDVLYHWSL
jgi:hypothetical protein